MCCCATHFASLSGNAAESKVANGKCKRGDPNTITQRAQMMSAQKKGFPLLNGTRALSAKLLMSESGDRLAEVLSVH